MTKDNGCIGSYSVSGYTRGNGVQVSGYTRTCGAAHSSSSSSVSTTSTPKLDDEEKMKQRVNILYGSDEEYMKKYYGDSRNIDTLNRLKNNELENLNDKIQEKTKEIELIKSNNYYFSDDEIAKARKFIQGEEKFVAEAYLPTQNDVWTIGYGHTGNVDGKPITSGMKITKEKAEELYRKDFEVHIKPLKEIEVPLTSNQKIALASFSFNLGPNGLRNSSIFKNLQKGDYKAAADSFDKYVGQRNRQTGKIEVLRGLVNRRKKEKELFLTPDEF
ncbi:MAG: lysozyme [Candidatus Gastranaerophilales bacterium]|nr:lysozyme [Candidatus Gastranaerophilales bacterium]